MEALARHLRSEPGGHSYGQCCVRQSEDGNMLLAVRRSRCLEAEEVVNECNVPGDVILSNHLTCPLQIMFIVSIR